MGTSFKNLMFEDEYDGDDDMCFMRLSPRLTAMRKEGQEDIAAVVEGAEEAATEFLGVFWGVFIDHSGFSAFSLKEKVLPWGNIYPQKAAEVIESIAAQHLSETFDVNAWWARFDDPAEDPKRLAQELAVAGLLVLDELLTELAFRGNLWRAMRYQNSLHYWVVMVHAFIRERFYRSQSDVAVVAANARHVENRAMKQEVWEWYQANGQDYRSMDAAAEAIAGKIAPIAFRTARAWVGEYRKKMNLMRSARRE